MIVVGSVNIDLVITTERLPGPGETVTGGRFARHHGGKGGNQAVAAARLGAETAFVGAIGGDSFGSEARTALEAEGIDLRGLVTIDGDVTGVALILVDAVGENLIAVAGGANAALTPAHVREALRILNPGHGDVILVGHEIPTTSALAALELGRLAGATTILNPAPAGGLESEILALADVLTPNRGELTALVAGRRVGPGAPGSAGTSTADAASALLGGAIDRAILVSLGPDGALLVNSDGATVLAAPPVDAVDTVGAGDTLNGALAAGLAAGLDLPQAAHRAVVAATLAVTRPGAREGMPTSAELQAAGG